MTSSQKQRQRRVKPAAVDGAFHLLGDVLNEELDEGGPITPRIIRRVRNAGDEIQGRLHESAKQLAKLRKLGWDGLGSLDDFSIWKESISKEKAVEELSSLGIDPRFITLQVVGTSNDGIAADGWIKVGEEFTVPERAVRKVASMPVNELSRMKVDLERMEKALGKERAKTKNLRGERKRVKSAEARAEKSERQRDTLVVSIRILTTFIEELLSQRYIGLTREE